MRRRQATRLPPAGAISPNCPEIYRTPCCGATLSTMTDPSNLPRLYDEKQVGKLLKRATELQREDPVRAAVSGGLSLAELEEIAGEAGIDPLFLRRAAAELASGGTDREGWERITGAPMTLVQEAVVAGELDQDGFERVVAAIQMTAHEHGQPSLLGRTLTWQAETASKQRTIQVTVISRNGETHIRTEERLHQMAAGLFAGSVVGRRNGRRHRGRDPAGLERIRFDPPRRRVPPGRDRTDVRRRAGDLPDNRPLADIRHRRDHGQRGPGRPGINRGSGAGRG